MSYTRRRDGSDVYLYKSCDRIICDICFLEEDARKMTFLDTAEAAFWHLVAHREAGHCVHGYAFARLEAEARTGVCHG